MKIKTCPFFINGPLYQRLQGQSGARVISEFHKLHTMQDWDGPRSNPTADYIMMPRVKFQAELQYVRIDHAGRILMKDIYGRQWSVFGACADDVLPRMQLGKITAWWIMAKKGQACGLTVDISQPLKARLAPNEDVPLMLEKATDLNTVIPHFEAMAV